MLSPRELSAPVSAARFDEPFELPAPGGRPRQPPGRLRRADVVVRLQSRDQRAGVGAFLIDVIVGDEIERLHRRAGAFDHRFVGQALEEQGARARLQRLGERRSISPRAARRRMVASTFTSASVNGR